MVTKNHQIYLPQAPVFAWHINKLMMVTSAGEIQSCAWQDVPAHIAEAGVPPILCYAPSFWRKLGIKPQPSYDLMELFAFVHPAQFCLPTLMGLADSLNFPIPKKQDFDPALALSLLEVLHENLTTLSDKKKLGQLALVMGEGGWLWTPFVLSALGHEIPQANSPQSKAAQGALAVWKNLPEWQDQAPLPPPNDASVSPIEARERLANLVGKDAENRPGQSDFASAVAAVFETPPPADIPRLLLAEAGTGIGKTLGYLAPASLWTEKNNAPVWVSTYTRNLQHQIDAELDRLYPDPAAKRQHVVIRKGRENYLCLLNYEEAVGFASVRPQDLIGLGLMARWITHSRDGDLTGGDFPSWLSDLVGYGLTLGLSDRRGECLYTSCGQYQRCFIERNIRRAYRADIVIANHALVMIQAAQGALYLDGRLTRLVFDEGHHVFEAADSAFATFLSGQEMAELRRWLKGREDSPRRLAAGLKMRMADLLDGDETLRIGLHAVLKAADCLAAHGWATRIAEGRFLNISEEFLYHTGRLVYARTAKRGGQFNLEIAPANLDPTFLDLCSGLKQALFDLVTPTKNLRLSLQSYLDRQRDTLDSTTRNKIEIMCRALLHRCEMTILAWISALERIITANQPAITTESHEAPDQPTPSASDQGLFVEWLCVERQAGIDSDVGLRCHWLDPAFPFAEAVISPTTGVVITSATLTDGQDGDQSDWRYAEQRTGANFLPNMAQRARVPSPFDYQSQARIYLVNDVNRHNIVQVSQAFRKLMVAAGGGAVGLFTAIHRLKAVYAAIHSNMAQANLSLYAQHIDMLNLPTLIDIFKAEENACLLGTDAVRDGVDVPGNSLRLLIFDRVPWPRPSYLHKVRRQKFGKHLYEESHARLKVKQAFGRLIRQRSDHGVFVMLDPQFPTRLCDAFPENAVIERIGIEDAIRNTAQFLSRTV